ncbi:MAG: hypothetical protein DRN04_17680 [Thermoprotei archaeon]|nr:MAG: hypothetical protein DRN04_17680 [Thermoprotei archaeon]
MPSEKKTSLFLEQTQEKHLSQIRKTYTIGKNLWEPFTLLSPETKTLLKLLEAYLREINIPPPEIIEPNYSDKMGLYIIVVLPCNASQALQHWTKILDELHDFNIPIFIKWTGKLDVSPEKLGTYLGKILAKMNIHLITEKPFDIVKILKEEWSL